MIYTNITIEINQYGQSKRSFDDLMSFFNELDLVDRKSFYSVLFELIQQSKCKVSDIDEAISNAKIKPTLNCCVIARKGINFSNIKRTENLKDVYPTLKFLANLFKIGYKRRMSELNSDQKWWYCDL